jgi:hypothetical protein
LDADVDYHRERRSLRQQDLGAAQQNEQSAPERPAVTPPVEGTESVLTDSVNWFTRSPAWAGWAAVSIL